MSYFAVVSHLTVAFGQRSQAKTMKKLPAGELDAYLISNLGKLDYYSFHPHLIRLVFHRGTPSDQQRPARRANYVGGR